MLQAFCISPGDMLFYCAPRDVGATWEELNLMKADMLPRSRGKRIEELLAYHASKLRFGEAAGRA